MFIRVNLAKFWGDGGGQLPTLITRWLRPLFLKKKQGALFLVFLWAKEKFHLESCFL